MIARYNLQVLIALLVVAVLASAIGIVHARYRHRQLFTELSRLEKTRDALNIEFSRLQLEQATLKGSSRSFGTSGVVVMRGLSGVRGGCGGSNVQASRVFEA